MKKLLGLALMCFALAVTSVSMAAENYMLNAGDRLNISVWNEDALNRNLVILPDGTVTFPLAGQLDAENKTVLQLEAELTEKLSEYIADPVVNVSVEIVEGNTIHILGKVQTPGSFAMSQPLDAMQALSLAGGLTTFAEENNIIVLRRKGEQQEILPVYYARIKKGEALESNVLLQSGDVMIIP